MNKDVLTLHWDLISYAFYQCLYRSRSVWMYHSFCIYFKLLTIAVVVGVSWSADTSTILTIRPIDGGTSVSGTTKTANHPLRTEVAVWKVLVWQKLQRKFTPCKEILNRNLIEICGSLLFFFVLLKNNLPSQYSPDHPEVHWHPHCPLTTTMEPPLRQVCGLQELHCGGTSVGGRVVGDRVVDGEVGDGVNSKIAER